MNATKWTAGFLFLFLLFTACKNDPATGNQKSTVVRMQADYPAAPNAEKKPQTFAEHGQTRVDNYYWLKDKTNPEVIRYLKSENQYADTVMAHTKAMREQLFKEMKGRIKEDDASVPVLDNGYYYYYRTEKDKQYRIHCRKKGSLDAAEEILLNGNTLAKGKSAFLFGDIQISPNNRLIAYSTNYTGSYVKFTLHFRDLEKGKDLPETLEDVASFVWANDNRTLFYTIPDEALRSYRLYRYELGSGRPAELLYEEKDQLFGIGLNKSRNGQFIFLGSGSFTSSEYRYLPANQPKGKFKLIAARKPDVQYYPEAHNDHMYFLVKDPNAKNFKVLEAPMASFDNAATWKDYIPHDPKVKIESINAFEKYLVMGVRTNGLQEIRVIELADKSIEKVSFPEPVYALYAGNTPEYTSTKFRYQYMSLNRPMSTFDYDMATGKSELKKQEEIPSGFEPSNYTVKRIWAIAPDGVKVPMALVYKKGLRQDGTNPTLLYSYGSYGYSTDPAFNRNVFSLIDRGFVYAIAQIRGGSDLGEQWYEDGKLLKKKNTFTDFIACAEKLIADKYTSKDLLAINGGSAGGLLMGAVTNMRPDLFKVVLAEVPFVDVINTMLDPTLPLTTQEYEQWGNPKDKTYYDYIRSYSPYDNIEKKNYPNMLITGGLNDSQVLFHEPAKYAAKLRELKTDNNLLMLRINMDSGHGGATGRFDYLKEEAFNYAFVMDRMGVKGKKLKN
ncbi:S9 family peptidase [Haliscomenobacter hydrossis]|uniref:Proline-specific endopeptidase n=1 Tax=Haliscomenobacter hydrossis (strain ATCC 27775 / DSM 1100 / LMG 10767 / O) TaxID=760192 RepID=F4KTG7_HALH1|nr:oligopeptidase B [Haliscomenobacter hydrossis]AEE52381.1 Oligopeptidase B [Haliscomenobacter hydrossis DSM 1100]